MMKRTIAISLLCMTTAAQAQLIVAHRGASHDAPENTLAAFNLAWEQGADAIEGDFQLTKDGHIIAFHDKDLERVAGMKTKVADMTLDEVRRIDVGTWKDPKWKDERPPLLRQVLATVPAHGRILIEIKCGPEIVKPLKAALADSALRLSQVRVIAFDGKVVAACKKALPNVKAYWLTGFKQDEKTKQWSPTLERIMDLLIKARADGLDCHAHETIDESFVRRVRDAGHEFHCWTINEVEVARRFQKLGVDSITTDRPGWLRDALGLPRPGRAQ